MSTLTYATKKGPRPWQEDHFFFAPFPTHNPRGLLLAVMDGHNGGGAAERCTQEFPLLLAKESLHEDDVENYLKTLVSKLNKITCDMESGTTLSTACVLEDSDEVIVAILGDSPVIVIDEYGHTHVSPEHNVRTNQRELEAAEARGAIYDGGYIFPEISDHVLYGLQMSRALGNKSLNRILSREPEIYTIRKPRWVLVCSDGVMDHKHENTESLVKELAEMRGHMVAEDIVNWAEQRDLKDNATAVLWRE